MPPKFNLIAEAQVPGISAQLRMWPRASTETSIYTAPVDILTYRCAPAAKAWSRSDNAPESSEFTPDGLLTFRPRGSTWHSRSDGAPQVTLVTRFERPLKYPGSGSIEGQSVDDPAIYALMRMLFDELREPGFSSTALIESVANALRVKLRRLVQTRQTDAPKDNMIDKDQISLIREFILSHKGRSLSVTELAELCQLSPRSLLRMFRARTGMTVAAYIAEVQLERSKALLINSNLMIKQVAFEMGFGDPNHFCNAFKRMTGYSPTEYRMLAKR